MKRLALAIVLTVLIASPESARAESPRVLDIALQQGGLFHGALVNRSGSARAGALVVVSQQGRPVAATRTNKDGWFSFRGLGGGVYRLRFQNSETVCRLWVPDTAPPCAKNQVLLVAGSPVALAQSLDGMSPAMQGALAGGLITAGTYWIIDTNDDGSPPTGTKNADAPQLTEALGNDLDAAGSLTEPDWAHDLKPSGS